MRAEIAHGKAYGALALGMGSRALFQRAQEQASHSRLFAKMTGCPGQAKAAKLSQRVRYIDRRGEDEQIPFLGPRGPHQREPDTEHDDGRREPTTRA